MAQTDPLRIDIVSDVVCPWCVIGYYQLKAALEATGTQAGIHWHPFELNPDMAPEGENLREHLAGKYGTTLEGSIKARAKLTQMGAELGFTFNYADDMRIYNTFAAHQLLHWAEEQGRGHDLKMALFGAFFTDRRDVSDIQVLVDVAAGIGLDWTLALAILTNEKFASIVRQREALWQKQGIRGVPAMIFDTKHLVTGAQGIENYIAILNKLAQIRAA